MKAGIADSGSIDLVQLGAVRAFETGEETLVFLGAVVPVRWLSEVFSFGDLIIACGLANLGFRVFFPLRDTATYYDEASEYDQYRDPDQPDPFEGYEPDDATWSASDTEDLPATSEATSRPQPGLSTLEGSALFDPLDEKS
tara:strand:+ start:471 stop:893 length:423 start_codon:yes stop_codon:yes gene_type:complete